MRLSIRDLIPDDLPAVTSIYADAVENGTASYEFVAPDLAEMTGRYEVLRSRGYPYLAAVDEKGGLAGYAYASSFRTRPPITGLSRIPSISIPLRGGAALERRSSWRCFRAAKHSASDRWSLSSAVRAKHRWRSTAVAVSRWLVAWSEPASSMLRGSIPFSCRNRSERETPRHRILNAFRDTRVTLSRVP